MSVVDTGWLAYNDDVSGGGKGRVVHSRELYVTSVEDKKLIFCSWHDFGFGTSGMYVGTDSFTANIFQ